MPMKLPEEFKQDVARVARSFDGPLSQVARDFGVSQPTLLRWISESRVDDGLGASVSASEFRATFGYGPGAVVGAAWGAVFGGTIGGVYGLFRGSKKWNILCEVGK